MKLFFFDKDDDPEMPDWQWGLFCFLWFDVLTFKLYRMKLYSWKEAFSFGFTFFDYSLLEFSFTVGCYDGLITILNFSSSRSSNYRKLHNYSRPIDS